MIPVTDQGIYSTLVMFAMIALFGGGIALLIGAMGRSRPGFAIGPPAAAAFGLRVGAAMAISLTSIARTLRGGDEVIFLEHADRIAQSPFGSSEWTHALTRELHVYLFALQRYFLDSPELAMRVTQVGIAVAGLVLLAAAVYELAGARASVVAMWALALEPAGMFFSSLMHKEANMMLATGLVALGGAKVWKRGETRYLALVAAGCLIAVGTRHYAGWFLIAAGAATVLHAGLRPENRGAMRSLVLVALVVLFAAVAAPTVLNASTNENLEKNLQPSQNANSSGSSNLSLERVDFSTRGAIARNLPKRIFDVLLRPFPWQLGDISQGLGLFGTAAAYLTLTLLVMTGYRNRGQIMARAGPFVYLGLFLLIAYALSAGNAGTGFRYRAQILPVFICIIACLWQFAGDRRRRSVSGSRPARSRPPTRVAPRAA